MKVTLEIEENKAAALLAILTDLPYAKVAVEPKPSVVEDLHETLEEVKLHQEGKVKLQTLKEVLNEL